ncbi:MAG: GNAT family N-acetyltransferase [Bacteroidales bacterium]|nr:GNAT family N-acetyltransferase [Bacteroidales bacterium]
MKFDPPLFQATKVNMLRYEDSFFDYFKQKYDDFEDWFFKESIQERDCWVYYTGDIIGALLIYKVEEETIPCTSVVLPKKRRFKICTFKVDKIGNKLGELLLKHSVKLTVSLGIEEMYLTHFTEKEDKLIELIQEYGFNLICTKGNNEDVYVKKLVPDESDLKSHSPIEIAKQYYPCFYDGGQVDKFLVPIYPKFHNRLFIDIPDGKVRQTRLSEYQSDLIPENEAKFIVEGNAIHKVYLRLSN